MEQQKQEVVLEKKEPTGPSGEPSEPVLRIPYGDGPDPLLNRQKKKTISEDKMAIMAADPNYHRVYYAIQGQSIFRVGRYAGYQTLTNMYTFIPNMGLELFGAWFGFEYAYGNLLSVDLEGGNTYPLGFPNATNPKGIVAYKNMPTEGDQLFVFLASGSNPGAFKMNPRNGLVSKYNNNSYTNMSYVCGDGANMVYYCDGINGLYSLDLDTNTTTQLTSVDWTPASAMCYSNGYLYATAMNGIWKITVPAYSPVRINYTNWLSATAIVTDGIDNNLFFTTTDGSTHKWWTVDFNDPLNPTWEEAGWGTSGSLIMFDSADPIFTVSGATVKSEVATKLGVDPSIVTISLDSYFIPRKAGQQIMLYYGAALRSQWINTELTPAFDVCIRQINAEMDISYGIGAACECYHPRYSIGYLRGERLGVPTVILWLLTNEWTGILNLTKARPIFFFNPLVGNVTNPDLQNWDITEVWG